jgi:hypothetical protein
MIGAAITSFNALLITAGIVTNPWGLLLVAIGGALSGIIACRVIEE